MSIISLPDRLFEILGENARPAPLRWLAREAQAPEGAVLAALKADDRFLGLPEGLWTTRRFGATVAGLIAMRLKDQVFGPRDLRITLGVGRKEVIPLLDWLQAKRWVERVEGGCRWIGPDDPTPAPEEISEEMPESPLQEQGE